MNGTTYALLVGIDDYPDPRLRLAGCVNDVTAFAEFLTARVPAGQLELKLLRNGEAKRQAVIDAFRSVLGAARAGDTAMFFYAGHGSQEPAAEQFWTVEPDRMNETLVLWDSRHSTWDLADKELAKLIGEVAGRGPHVLIVLDCCHSGSGTRNLVASRRCEADRRQRPLDTYLMTVEEALANATTRSLSGWNATGTGRHILMAACRDDEEAKEYRVAGQSRGAFSYFLLEVLKAGGRGLTYRDAFQRTQAAVRSAVQAQTPQLETGEEAELDRAFLGGAIQVRTGGFLARFNHQEGWVLEAGSIHGLLPPDHNETTTLALFEFGADANARPAAVARVTEVLPARSRMAVIDGSLQTHQTYNAVITGVPMPPMPVRLEGDPAGVALVEKAVAASHEVRKGDADAALRVVAAGNEFRILAVDSDRLLVAPTAGYSREGASRVASQLEHIARWRRLSLLDNPGSSIAANEVTMTLYEGAAGDSPLEGSDLRVSYQRDGAKWINPSFRVKFRNHGQRELYCGLVGLGELYDVSPLLRAGCIKLKPGQEAWALDGQPIFANVSPQLLAGGATESRDVLKLIVSTRDFDIRLLEQGELDAPRTRSLLYGQAHKGTLNRLLERVQTRGFSDRPDKDETIDDFAVRSITITTVRPREAVTVSSAAPAALDAGVVIRAHSSFRADARLTTMAESRGDLGNLILPPLLRDGAGEPLVLGATRGSSPPLQVLEFSRVVGFDQVTAQNPLRVELPVVLTEGETILPVGFDGEFFLPLGTARRGSGVTVMELTRLPDPIARQRRSLGGSIRILFQKLVTRPLGLPYRYPILATADVDAQGHVVYGNDMAEIRRRIQSAERIVLFVHGIIGDTLGMPGSVALDGPKELALTFDYENLHTSIEENAALLREKLVEAGLGPGHNKQLQIAAHSMGGLVSRWLLERLGGNQMVEHLVMLGTPNAGSPWSTVEDWVTGAAAMALNGMTAVAWPARLLGGLLGAVERVDHSLDQMKPGSAFLKELAQSPDPHVRYTILAGNTSLIKPALQAPEGQASLLERLWSRLSLKKLLHHGMSLAFFFEPNDIAVSVESVNHVDRGRLPPATRVAVACDHLTYFSSSVGSSALAQALQVKKSVVAA